MFNHLLEKINKPVNLLPHQVDHVAKIWESITTKGELSYIDTSRTGLGKTHVALELAYRLQRLFGMRVGIVAPNRQSLDNDDGWLYWAKQYGVVIEKATTYAALRGSGLRVYDDWLCKNNENKKKGYHASPKFNAMAEAGIFLIFDEFHMATRESSTHYACAALVRACSRNYTKCRVGLLSLTPGDQISHCTNIMRLAGIIRSIILCQHIPFKSEYIWEKYGLGEMVNACIARGVPSGEVIGQVANLSMTRCRYLVAYFYNQYIKPRICFAMPIPDPTNEVRMRNCFLECHPKDIDNLNNAIARLCEGVNWNGLSADEKDNWNIGQINIALKLIERYKLRTVARYIKTKLSETPNKKFVVSLGARSTEHFDMLKNMLSGVTVPSSTKILLDKARSDPTNVWSKVNKDIFNMILTIAYQPPVDIMNGSTKPKERIKILRRFQAENSDSWCLLISPGVGDKSISLQDKHGNHPRELIVVPDHYHTRVSQTCGRTDRIGVKSDVDVSIVYCKEARLETSVLHSMIAKSVIAKNMLAKDQEHVFPGKYDVWVEKDKNNELTTAIKAKLNL